MKTVLKQLLISVALSAATLGAAHAQTFPSKPMKIVVPFGPGGATDLVGRVLAERLQDQFGQPVVVENRPGASTAIGADAVARATPDGHTLLVSGSSTYTVVPALKTGLPYDPLTSVPALKTGLPYDPLTSFDLLSIVADAPMVLVVADGAPQRSTADLIAAAKARPGGLSYATFGPGSAPHLLGEMFGLAAGVKLLSVPYRGSAQAVVATLGGEIDMAFDTLSSALPHIQGGKLRPLAVFSKARVPQLPDVPTVTELGLADATFSGWYGVALPAGTPADVRATLTEALQTAMATDAVRQVLDNSALVPTFVPEADFRKIVAQEIATFRDVAQRANIVLE